MKQKNSKKKYILAIESSCDDSAVAILDPKQRILANTIFKSIDYHIPFGGIIPEIASKSQNQNMPIAVKESFNLSRVKKSEIRFIAATIGPGLIGSLIIGTQFAKGFSLGFNSKFIGIHHVEGHSMTVNSFKIKNRYIIMIASGGHSSIYFFRNNKFKIIGKTRDDSAGDAFDKIGRMLNYPYPAGPILDRKANSGNNLYRLPIAFNNNNCILDYSFSGFKTAVFRLIKIIKKKILYSQIKSKTTSAHLPGKL
jgi:N6-L-threonylcarbamoyladenine synthase